MRNIEWFVPWLKVMDVRVSLKPELFSGFIQAIA